MAVRENDILLIILTRSWPFLARNPLAIKGLQCEEKLARGFFGGSGFSIPSKLSESLLFR